MWSRLCLCRSNLLIGLIFLFLVPSIGIAITEDVKLTAFDAAASDLFGFSVSVSGDTVVVGAIADDDAGADSGSAYVFLFDGTTWVETKLAASDAAAGDLFGASVSVSGDTVVVGANENGDAGFISGSVYVFRFDGATWVETKLTASDAAAGDLFGTSVSASGDIVVVGAYGNDDAGMDSGSVYVFRFDGATWVETKLTASDAAAGDLFGYSVSASGDTVVVGAVWDDDAGMDSGSAYVFRFDGATWVETKLTASDAAAGDFFGYSVSVSGDTVLVGAWENDDAGPFSGSAYVFRFDGATWVETKLTASDAAANARFGRSVSVSGDTAVVGADANDGAGSGSGSAYVFRFDGATWVETKLTASDAAASDFFGHSVSVSGDTVVAGAVRDDEAGNVDAGSAYIFSLILPSPVPSLGSLGVAALSVFLGFASYWRLRS